MASKNTQSAPPYVTVTIRMSPDIHAGIKRVGKLHDRSMAASIRRALVEYVERNEA